MNHDLLRFSVLAIAAISAIALASAYVAQYAFNLEPCILCLYQRIPYAIAGSLALLALFVPPLAARRRVVVALCGAAFFIGGAIAFYHVGVEQHWWASATGCGGAIPGEMTTAQFKNLLSQKHPKACDDVDWTLFGLSMATYNVVFSLALALGCLATVRKTWRTQT
jgi:disulfide bond formation protein DsbB